MKAKIYILSILIGMLLVSGCGNQELLVDNANTVVSMQAIKENAQVAYHQYTPAEIDASLDKLAQLFAYMINSDREMKAFVGEQVGKKFDDDYDALYDMIADLTYNNRTLRGELKKLAKERNLDLHSLTQVIPYLNLAIPVNFDQWASYTGPIYVIPLQYSVDDSSISEYIGYDGSGDSRVFDAVNKPEIPVLVLGINERIEYMEQKAAKVKTAESGMSPMAIDDGLTTHNEKLESVYLKITLDNWPHGNPELYVLAVVGENYILKKFYYEFADATNTWIPINEGMFTYKNIPANMYYWMQLRDYDGGTSVQYPVSESFNHNNVNYKITGTYSTTHEIGDGDDNFGETLIYYWHSSTGASYPINEGATTNAYVKVGF